MAMDDDRLLRERIRPRSTLLPGPGSQSTARLPETADGETELDTWEEYDPLPQPGSPYESAFARPGNKPEPALHVMLKDGYSRGYAWSNFDSVDTAPGEGPGSGPVLVVRFAGLVPTELRISGSNLGRLHACLGRQRVAWIREQPSGRGFEAVSAPGEKKAIIASIVVRRWKPERPAGGGE